MARKPNYNFEKRRKELDRKAEKEEKLRRRREKSANPQEQDQPTELPEAESPDTSPDESAS